MTTISKPGEDRRIQITPKELQLSEDTSKWFTAEVKIPAQAQALLEQYSGFAHDEVAPHVADLRARAFQTWPYPCIGLLRFLDLITSKHPSYAEVLSCVKSGQTFLDAGCCLGQDLRKLMYDGAPSSSALYGLDVEAAFFDLGFELFRDKTKMHATFVAADLTHPSVPSVVPFHSSIDIVSAQSFLHLFSLEDQKNVAQHLVRLTKPRAGSMIIGRQVGTMEAREVRGLSQNTVVFTHNVASLNSYWQDVGAATGSRWKVDATIEEAPERVRNQSWSPSDIIYLVFTVLRE